MGGIDFLYCTDTKVDLQEIQAAALSIGYQAYQSLTVEPELVVEFPRGGIAWWYPTTLDEMATYTEDSQMENIQRLHCRSFIELTCKRGNFPELIDLFKLIMQRYGGCLTCDSATFYDVRHIHELAC